MALPITAGAPTLVIRKSAYESSGLTRASIDERLGLTPDEFRVEGDLVAVGAVSFTQLRAHATRMNGGWGPGG